MTWTNPAAMALAPLIDIPRAGTMNHMNLSVPIANTPQSTALSSPRGAGTQNRTLWHLIAGPDTRNTTYRLMVDIAGTQIHIQNIYFPREANTRIGTQTTSLQRLAESGVRGGTKGRG